jgi:hypothetical protein
MTDRDLELLLQRSAASMAYPATPQLGARVLGAIATPVPRRVDRSRPRLRRPAFAFASVAAAFAAMIALAVPTSRSAIADFFGIDGSEIERLPSPAPGTTATPFPTPQSLPSAARAASLAEIASALGFAPALVDGEEPASSYLVDLLDESVAVLRYPEFDLWQSELSTVVAQKQLSGTTRLEEFTLEGGVPARWVTGGEYVLVFVDPTGEEIDASFRVVDRSTLIWRTDRAFYRLETTLDRDAATAIAESLP